MDNILLPSQCKDKYIFMPSERDDFDKVARREGGKWLLNTEDSNHDSHWEALLPLYHDGLILALRANTPEITDIQRKTNALNKVIWCFAEDADDLENVRRVANAIRSATNHGRIMYYKTNAASANRLFHEDTTAICKYMHSVKGQLFRRDEYKRWEMV
ncbi:uncharacterized protein CEXT_753741 [Caerostris extrusa]|uniref:Uncharacterized protein n=1 Tax=Caerostris extrusa TaxID=172846 RepID=A0AAV4YCJ6_CAEEX|nr:uncharacterized protein CEXT_753741 [Caerostris extrusa]